MAQPYQGQPGEEIDLEKVDVYRGGPDLVPKPDEYKIDPATGNVKCSHGVSLESDAGALARFGTVRRITGLPPALRIVRRGRRPTHFEIVPRQPMSPSDYERALGQVTLE